MRIVSRVCAVVSWVLLVIALFAQVMLILTFTIGGGLIGRPKAQNVVNQQALPFVIAGTVLFVAGFFLFRFVRRARWGWYAAMTAGALLLAGVGLFLKVSYPETILSNGVSAGYYSMVKLIWRHMLPLGVVLLQLLVGVFRQKAEDKQLREEALRDIEEEGFKPRFE